MDRRPIILAERLALTVAETAADLSVSERHLRELLPEIPHVHLGGRVVIPVEQMRKWLAEQTKIEPNRIAETVTEILSEIA